MTTNESHTVSAESLRTFRLHAQGLLEDPTRKATAKSVQAMIERMGFVQIDTIRTVERAHHHILWTRFDSYRPRHLKNLLETKRSLFEHWTHDASAIPVSQFQWWRARFKARPTNSPRINQWWRERFGPNPRKTFERVREHIRSNGPTRSAEFTRMNGGRGEGQGAWWGWTPEKAALEMLWRAGELTVVKRINFHKVYDLTERAFPDQLEGDPPRKNRYIDWACRSALDRLGCATSGDLAKFWGHMPATDARKWCDRAAKRGEIVPVEVKPAKRYDKPKRMFAYHDWRDRLSNVSDATAPRRTRLLSPFDPIVRDRANLEMLFGFDYRFEAFVPEKKRKYGYYVFPIMEGDRFVGRIDPKLHRDRGILEIKGLWWEKAVKAPKARRAKLDEALERLCTFVGANEIEYS